MVRGLKGALGIVAKHLPEALHVHVPVGRSLVDCVLGHIVTTSCSQSSLRARIPRLSEPRSL